MAYLFTTARYQALDNNGDPIPAARLFFYENQSTTPKNAFADSDLNTPHTNPVIADAFGRFDAIWLDTSTGNYTVKLTTAANVQIFSDDDVGASDITQSRVAVLMNPITAVESSVGAVVTDYLYPVGHVKRYGAIGDRIADDTVPIQTAIDVIKEAGAGEVRIPAGFYKITAALTYVATTNDDSIAIRGDGSHANGSVICNETNDVDCLYINGDVIDDTTDRADRIVLEDFRIIHRGATKYGLRAEDAPYLFANRIAIYCENAGYGAAFLGTTAVVPDSDNFLSAIRDCDFRKYVSVGLRINSKGHTVEVTNSKIGGGGADAYDCWFQSEGIHVIGGQLGGSKRGVVWDNQGAGDIEYGSMRRVKIEGIGAGETGVKVTGSNATPRDFQGITFAELGVNMAAMSGDFLHFYYARQCRVLYPVVRNPKSGTGKLANLDEHCDQIELVFDYEAAQAALTVHASANRCVKRVTGLISRSQVANITVYPNLRTILQDGVDDLPPGFVPVHANGAWNYWLVTLADDAASSFTLPAVSAALVRARVTVLSDRGVTFQGVAVVGPSSGAATISPQGVGADFETATGALAGTTGTDIKITLSAHTDGKIYLENRSGATGDFTVLIQPVIFGT